MILPVEISRLGNSIEHLKSTQDELRKYIDEEPEGDDDEEIEKAMKENEEVMCVISRFVCLNLSFD